jgi:hypothetical protein
MAGRTDCNTIVGMRATAGGVGDDMMHVKSRLQVAGAMLAGVVLACRDLGTFGRAE